MKRLALFPFALAALLGTGFFTSGFAGAQGDEASRLSAEDLKVMLTNLGHDLKQINAEAGKEKFEFTIKTPGFNVPVGAEISPSKQFVWLTVSLGALNEKQDTKELLRLNGRIQPTQAYLTAKDTLMMAFALDNRAITPALMKNRIEKLTGDVEKSAPIWNKS
ncbi:MAG: hypothetical protein WCK51_01335 [Armatimonadota bacterium]